jgi:hypothetical protein
MGWGRFLFLGNLGQQMDLSDHEMAIHDMKQELWRDRNAESRTVERLQDDIDRLRLYLAVVMQIILSKGIVTKDELQKIVDAIDAEDGVMDNKRSIKPQRKCSPRGNQGDTPNRRSGTGK